MRYATGDVTLRAERRSDTVELHVEDEGPGFPEGFLAVAFGKFTPAGRLEPSTAAAARTCGSTSRATSVLVGAQTAFQPERPAVKAGSTGSSVASRQATHR